MRTENGEFFVDSVPTEKVISELNILVAAVQFTLPKSELAKRLASSEQELFFKWIKDGGKNTEYKVITTDLDEIIAALHAYTSLDAFKDRLNNVNTSSDLQAVTDEVELANTDYYVGEQDIALTLLDTVKLIN